MRQHIQVILAALLVLVFGFFGYSLLFDLADPTSLTIVEASGDVSRVDSVGRSLDAVVGTQLRAQERLSTGDDGHVVLAIDDESQIRLENTSSVRVLGIDSTGIRVELEGGRVHARVRTGSPELGINSRGRSVVITDADLVMGVDDEGALVVDAERGTVALQGFDGVDQLSGGERLRSMPGHMPVVGDVPSSLLLEVAWPEAATTREHEVDIEGRTEPFALVKMPDDQGDGGRRIRAGPDGRFEATVPLEEGDNTIQVQVSDPMGNREHLEHAIRRDSTAPSVTSTEVLYGQ